MFQPKLHSVIIALNMSRLSDELAAISSFYQGPITGLRGCFQGVTERSYQLDSRYLNLNKMKEWLHRYNQEMILYVRVHGVYAAVPSNNYEIDRLTKSCGQFELTEEPTSDYTYCRTTGTYWEIR